MSELVAIFGPTAVGKTQTAIELAELLRERGEQPAAISADAIQVYEGLGVLSGKPSPDQLERLEHRLISFVPIETEFSAGEYAGLAHAEIDQLLSEDRRPIVVGGTGLYLRAALTNLDLKPAPDPDVRAAIEADVEQLGTVEMHARLPVEVAARVHPNDRTRIVRGLELQATGERPHSDSNQLWSDQLRLPTKLFGLVMDRELLAERVSVRVDEMMEAGASGEADGAIEYEISRTAAKTLGLRELAAHAAGDVERDDAVAEIKRRHMALAKRQMTWMRKLPNVELIDRGEVSEREAAGRILSALA